MYDTNFTTTTRLSSRLSAIPPDYQNWWVTFWSLGLHVLFINQNPSIHGFNALILWEDPNLGSDELASALRRRHAGASMGQRVWQPVDRVGTHVGAVCALLLLFSVLGVLLSCWVASDVALHFPNWKFIISQGPRQQGEKQNKWSRGGQSRPSNTRGTFGSKHAESIAGVILATFCHEKRKTHRFFMNAIFANEAQARKKEDDEDGEPCELWVGHMEA